MSVICLIPAPEPHLGWSPSRDGLGQYLPGRFRRSGPGLPVISSTCWFRPQLRCIQPNIGMPKPIVAVVNIHRKRCGSTTGKNS